MSSPVFRKLTIAVEVDGEPCIVSLTDLQKMEVLRLVVHLTDGVLMLTKLEEENEE